MSIKFNSSDKVLVLDFDHTCYDTDAFLLNEIRHPMMMHLRIPAKEWEESYEKAVKQGYTLFAHMSELNKIMDPLIGSWEETFEHNISFDKYLYPDAIPFLVDARKKGYKIMLLSFGAKDWQNEKVKGVGLDKFIDVIEYTKEEGSKAEVLMKYIINSDKVVFVDNNGIDLNAVHKVLPSVKTYYMNRPYEDIANKEDIEYMRVRYMESRKITERQALLIHKRVSSLAEINLQ